LNILRSVCTRYIGRTLIFRFEQCRATSLKIRSKPNCVSPVAWLCVTRRQKITVGVNGPLLSIFQEQPRRRSSRLQRSGKISAHQLPHHHQSFPGMKHFFVNVRGRCYDPNFLRFSPIFCKNGVFL
jgi:hypothetical protein